MSFGRQTPSSINVVCGCGAGFWVYYRCAETPVALCPACGSFANGEIAPFDGGSGYDEEGPEVQVVLYQEALSDGAHHWG